MVWRRIWFLCSLQFLITNSSWTEKLDHGSISGFPSYDEANKLLEQFLQQHPNELTKQQIGKSFESRPIYAYILGTRDGRQQHPPQVLLTALTHAREPAGLTVLIYFLGHLLDQFQQGDAQARYILEMREVWFVPFVNPDGYVANQVIRKNRRPTCRSSKNGGVDLNRNFGVHWSSGFDGCNEEHGGKQPFSEPETQALKTICEDNSFKTAMNFHAYGSMLTHPYNWANTDLLPAEDKAVYKEIARVFGFKKFGTAIQTVGYTTTGESDDWMYSARHIISMSPEVGPESGGFWPPRSEIAGINSRNFDRTSYVVLKAGMELMVEGAYQRLEEFLQKGPRPPGLDDLVGGIPESLLQIRISNLGLSSSVGKVLHVGIQGVAVGTPGDGGLLLQDGKTQQLFAANGIISFQVGTIEKRSSRTVWIIPARSWQAGTLLTCVAEAASGSRVCHCSSSGREIYALPDSTISGSSKLCAAALGVQGFTTAEPIAEVPGVAQTRIPATTGFATTAPFFQIASGTTRLPFSLGQEKLMESSSLPGDLSQDTVSATWLLLALGITFVGMFLCLFMQSYVVPRAVARRAPTALDYERIPGLQVSRVEEDSDDLGFSPHA